jgi:hypothetical protein
MSTARSCPENTFDFSEYLLSLTYICCLLLSSRFRDLFKEISQTSYHELSFTSVSLFCFRFLHQHRHQIERRSEELR